MSEEVIKNMTEEQHKHARHYRILRNITIGLCVGGFLLGLILFIIGGVNAIPVMIGIGVFIVLASLIIAIPFAIAMDRKGKKSAHLYSKLDRIEDHIIADAAKNDYANETSTIEKLEKLSALYEKRHLTKQEYEKAKKEILNKEQN